MQLGFVNTVSAFCYSVVRDEPTQLCTGEPCDVSTNGVVNFVLDQHARMPDYLRLPLFLLTLLFNVCGVLYGGTLFHRMAHPERQRQIEAWRRSRVAPLRDFVRFHESLAIFCWYSMLSARLHEGEEAAVTRAELEWLQV